MVCCIQYAFFPLFPLILMSLPTSDTPTPVTPDSLSSALSRFTAAPKVSTLVRPLPNSYWATPQVVASEYPGDLVPAQAQAKLQALLDANITDFIDLTEEGELRPYHALLTELAATQSRVVRYHRFAIPDVGLPTPDTLRQALALLRQVEEQGRKAVVHCWGGIGRTGTVVGCHLVQHYGLSGPNALAHLAQQWQGVAKRHRVPRVPETDAQHRLVATFQPLPLA